MSLPAPYLGPLLAAFETNHVTMLWMAGRAFARALIGGSYRPLLSSGNSNTKNSSSSQLCFLATEYMCTKFNALSEWTETI